MITAVQALERLKDGNARFRAELRRGDGATESRRRELADGQEPFAIILGCSDSRVPAELVFAPEEQSAMRAASSSGTTRSACWVMRSP